MAPSTPVDEPAGASPEGGSSGAVWIAASRIAALASQFALMLIAARYLGPAQFGVYTLIASSALLVSTTARAGWMECIMTARDPSERAQANTLALGVGIVAVGLGTVASLVLDHFTSDRIAVETAEVLAVSLLPACISAPQYGVLMSRKAVPRVAQSQIIGDLTGLAVGMICLNLRWGMLGLAAAKIVSEAVSCAAMAFVTRWYPLARIDRERGLRILGVWKNLASATFMNIMSTMWQTYLLGAFAGATETGLYRAGVRFSGVVTELVAEPSRVTYWPVIRSAHERNGNQGIAAAAVPLSATTFLFGVPLAVGLAATSDTLVAVALGATWEPAAPIIALTALAIVPRLPTYLCQSVLPVTGHDRLLPRLSLWSSVLSLGALACTVWFGALWVAVGALVASTLYLPVCMIALRVVPELKWSELWQRYAPILTAAVVMVAAVRAVTFANPELSPVVMLVMQVTLGATVYLGTIYSFSPQEFKRAIGFVTNRRRRSLVP